MEWQLHQLNHIQIMCTYLQTDNHASITSLKFFTDQMLFLMPNQQHKPLKASFHLSIMYNKNKNGLKLFFNYIKVQKLHCSSKLEEFFAPVDFFSTYSSHFCYFYAD